MISTYKLFEEKEYKLDIPGSIAATIALNAAIYGGRKILEKNKQFKKEREKK